MFVLLLFIQWRQCWRCVYWNCKEDISEYTGRKVVPIINTTQLLLFVSVDLNAADTGVQLKPSATGGTGDRKPTGNQPSQQSGGKGCCWNIYLSVTLIPSLFF